MPGILPIPTPIYRFLHIDNLALFLMREALHAPNHCPEDGFTYKIIHNEDIQNKRKVKVIPCGPQGVIHDYVPFYFGYRSPMLLQLKTGRVAGYSEGQEPLIYLCSAAQEVENKGLEFVFSDGHGIAAFTNWFDDLNDLDKVDWDMVYQRYWSDDNNNPDRQRRKQAEFVVYKTCPWSVIEKIVVIDNKAKVAVETILADFSEKLSRPVQVRRDWYY